MTDYLWDVAAAVFIVSVLYVLVRPGGNGPALVNAFGGAFVDVVGFATGAL